MRWGQLTHKTDLRPGFSAAFFTCFFKEQDLFATIRGFIFLNMSRYEDMVGNKSFQELLAEKIAARLVFEERSSIDPSLQKAKENELFNSLDKSLRTKIQTSASHAVDRFAKAKNSYKQASQKIKWEEIPFEPKQIPSKPETPKIRPCWTIEQIAALKVLQTLGAPDLNQDADVEDIKKSYRKLVRHYHPDAHPQASEFEQRQFANKFQSLQEAYSILTAETEEAFQAA